MVSDRGCRVHRRQLRIACATGWACAQLKWQRHIPEGFANGSCVIGDGAHIPYKCTDYYSPAAVHALIWNDPGIGIGWPVREPVVSDKDARGKRLADCHIFA